MADLESSNDDEKRRSAAVDRVILCIPHLTARSPAWRRPLSNANYIPLVHRLLFLIPLLVSPPIRYIDLAKTYSVILTSLYKTLGNILVRTQHETAKVRSILDKRERSDVRGDESLLGRGERDALRDWEEKRLRLGVLERRVEECVFVLRDLAPDGYAGEHSGR